ncbi:MAG: preprotein translocase subunit SecE [Candidatus Thermochlorobacter aerophilum]|jgi:preprotein translocase subunit SecE|uniref:Protein translocase subunit SecE n=1 Tax=Candidatus Thermochlorobacter aerophilus TaxID=1868324 RepID=A0A395M0L6_9BACT|nr:MAG: preprotein translocase subunit SecE [Candidatus Thermochlorobacter aerophilum]
MKLTEKIGNYYNDVVAEMKKVTWPSKDELRESTLVVLTVAGILALFTFVIDESLNLLIKQFLR